MIKRYWKYLKILRNIAQDELHEREKMESLKTKFNIVISPKAILRLYDQENIHFGKGCKIGPYTTIIQMNEHAGLRNSVLKVGEGSSFGGFCNIRAGGGTIMIGKHCLIAQGVNIIASNHKFDELDKPIVNQPWDYDNNQVDIGDYVWIGCNVVILPGAIIGKNCVVAAGAVVTKGIYPDGAILAGNPAKEIKNRYKL